MALYIAVGTPGGGVRSFPVRTVLLAASAYLTSGFLGLFTRTNETGSSCRCLAAFVFAHGSTACDHVAQP